MKANTKDKTELFETMPVPKAVAKLSVPTIAASLVMLLYNLADTFFVGLLNEPLETSAVTLAAPVILAFNAVTNLFGVGASSLMSRALGVKDYDTVKKASATGLYWALFSAALLSLLTTVFRPGLLNLLGADSVTAERTARYLFWTVTCGAVPSILDVVMSNLIRGEGSSMQAGLGIMGGCALNIVLDPFFILPQWLNMGAAGAGCATFISTCVSLVYYLAYLIIKRSDTRVCLNPRMARPDREVLKEVFGVGVPASIQNLLNVTGMTILNNRTASYGPEAVSAMGISHKISLVPLYFSMGGGQGIMPLVGYNYSSGNRARMKETIRFTEKLFACFMLVASVLMFTFSGSITALFMKNGLIVEYGTGFLRGFSSAALFLAFDFLAVAIFQACGKGGYALVFAIARKIVLEIPGFLLMEKLFGMYGLAYGQLIAEFVLSIAGFVIMEKLMNQAPAKL